MNIVKPKYNRLTNGYSLSWFKYSDKNIIKFNFRSISEEYIITISWVHLSKEVSQQVKDKLSLDTTKNNPLSGEANIIAETEECEGKSVILWNINTVLHQKY